MWNNIFVRNILKRKYFFAALTVGIFFWLVSFFSVTGFNLRNPARSGAAITGDEVTYLASGYYYAAYHRYFLNTEHPPLIKDIAALPSLWFKPRLLPLVEDGTTTPHSLTAHYPYTSSYFPKYLEIHNQQWQWAKLFLFGGSVNPDQLLVWGRMSILTFNVALLLFLFYSIGLVWNKRTALISLFFLVLMPFSAAYAPLIILDYTSALLQVLSILWFALYLRALRQKRNGYTPVFIFTLCFALAALTKSTSLLVVPVVCVGSAVYFLIHKVTAATWARGILGFIGSTVVALVIVVLNYAAHVYAMSQLEISAQVMYLTKGWVQNLFLAINTPHVWSKALIEYGLNISLSWQRVALSVQHVYFNGAVYGSEGAGLWYYPTLMAYKIPLAVWFLVLVLLIIIAVHFAKKSYGLSRYVHYFFEKPCALLLILFALAYALIVLATPLDMGIRYVLLPLIIGTVFVARLTDIFWDVSILRIRFKYILYGVLIVLLVVAAHIFPYFLSYYNYLGGGIKNGYTIAVDSNYDWGGQDIKKLALWRDAHPDAQLYGDLFALEPLEFYLGPQYHYVHIERSGPIPPGSYVAVSAHEAMMKLFDPSTRKPAWHFMSQLTLVERIGTTIFLYRVAPAARN